MCVCVCVCVYLRMLSSICSKSSIAIETNKAQNILIYVCCRNMTQQIPVGYYTMFS